MTHDPINRPSHYAEGRRYEPINVIEDWKLSYRLGNVVKYVSRAGRKDPAKTVEDLKKAQWYLNREIEALEASTVPYAVTYEDVLQDYAACAAEGYEYNAEQSLDSRYALWDDTLGPVEPYEPTPRRKYDFLGQAEWDTPDPEEAALRYFPSEVDLDELHKDLDEFEENEILHTFERRGIVFGVDKNGTTYTLGVSGGTTK